MRVVLRYLRDFMLLIIKWMLFLIPKNKNLIMANSWFGQKYADNTMYEYEYLLTHTNYQVVWTTKNRQIYDKLKEEGKPVVKSDTIKGLWMQIRARMLLSTIQHHDYNKYLLCNCILLDLDHGIIFKQVGFDINPNDQYQYFHHSIIRKYVDYYMTTPSFLTEKMMEHSYHIRENNAILCGKARLDYFFDESLRNTSTLLAEAISGRKTIVYMPTHRTNGRKKIEIERIMDLRFIDELCDRFGYVFIIKKHFYHRDELTDTALYKNIIDLTQEAIDAQEMLFNADILITDYSSCYIDYLLLDRPLVLYTYDLEEYLKEERGLFVSFDRLNIGYQPKTKEQLNKDLMDIVSNSDDRYKDNRKNAKAIYFDQGLDIGNSRQEICNIINGLMDGTYRTEWESIRTREEKRSGVLELIHDIQTM